MTGDEIFDYLLYGVFTGLGISFLTWFIIHFVAGFVGFVRRWIA